MTIDEAIGVLKMEITKARTDFYKDRIEALSMAIDALYRRKYDETAER